MTMGDDSHSPMKMMCIYPQIQQDDKLDISSLSSP